MAPFEKGKRYLLRIINTSFSSTFNFTIDNHELEVVEADFVPIKPYTTTNVLVAIGQRYHVIVNADPIVVNGIPLPEDNNYWIRTWEAQCSDFKNNHLPGGYETTGIIRYVDSPLVNPSNSTAWNDSKQGCVDEDDLSPIYSWTVKSPSNSPQDQSLTVNPNDTIDTIYPLAEWTLTGDLQPFKIDYSNPTFLNLNYTGEWDPLWVVVPEDYTPTDWVSQHSHRKPHIALASHTSHLHLTDSLSCCIHPSLALW